MLRANPLNITQIDHVVIRVEHLDAAVAFYRDVLGLKLERGPGEIGLAQLRAGRSLIDLVDVTGPLGREGGGAPDRLGPNMDHVCLEVDPWDPEAVAEHLRSHGIEPPDVARRYGARGSGPSIYIRDPEGNTIELKGRVR